MPNPKELRLRLIHLFIIKLSFCVTKVTKIADYIGVNQKKMYICI